MDPLHDHDAETALSTETLAALTALAEPNRARIFELLRHGEHCVCDVGDMLGMSTALVSHHLRALRASGLIRERRSGRWVYYSLDLERVAATRSAVTALLSPGSAATTTCRCSDCGARGAVPVRPGRGAGLLVLPERAP
jgi:ArsR family transcriptional regulator